MKKILLTGSTGFVGSALLRSLSKKYKVYVILRKKNQKVFKNKNIIKIIYINLNDLNKKISKLKINTVIHCATHYVKKHSFEDIKRLCDSNILFGNIILENLKIMGVKKFINFSTVWENYDGKKGNYYNLYSAYKACFINLINYYKKKLGKINFLNLTLSDTFGLKDKRNKLINILRLNYKKNRVTKIVSRNLYMNLLNVTDVENAIDLILKKNYRSGTYILKNNRIFKVIDLINNINKNRKKIRVKWLSNKILKEKTYKFTVLKNWKPVNSKIEDIVKIITN